MSATAAPRIETARLVLRGPEPRDAAAFVAFQTSDRARFTGGPMDRAQAWCAFAADIGHWHLRGFGLWTVTRKGDDSSLGLVGCWYPEAWPEREIGWLLWPGAEGQGFAREAADAALDHAFGPLGWPTAVSYIDRDNARSIRLAERLGAQRDPDAVRLDPKDLVFRHPPRNRTGQPAQPSGSA